jgi:membrane-bound lytic murein transglycosylase B
MMKVLVLVGAVIVAMAPRPQTLPQAPPQAAPRPTFEEFLAGIRAEARALGVRSSTLDAALTGLEPLAVVIERDRAQPELTQSLDDYLRARLTDRRVTTGRSMVVAHRALLGRIEQAYGIPSHLMVAIWGLESNFGAFTGTHPTITSLATLAYDGRRTLFRGELLAALQIIDAGHATPETLKGSWAGAMGQPQFMPTSFLRTAVDFDGDGRIDIWSSVADVFGSMANYLKAAGWRPGERWGREVAISKAVMAKIDKGVPMRTRGCRAFREMTERRPLADWTALGVTRPDGEPLPESTMAASLVRGQARHFLVYENFDALLGYNCSNAYGVSVGMLGDAISSRAGPSTDRD